MPRLSPPAAPFPAEVFQVGDGSPWPQPARSDVRRSLHRPGPPGVAVLPLCQRGARRIDAATDWASAPRETDRPPAQSAEAPFARRIRDRDRPARFQRQAMLAQRSQRWATAWGTQRTWAWRGPAAQAPATSRMRLSGAGWRCGMPQIPGRLALPVGSAWQALHFGVTTPTARVATLSTRAAFDTTARELSAQAALALARCARFGR